MSGAPEVLAVMATGMWKSLLFQLPSHLPGAGTTILVVPLVALRVNQLRRLTMGLDCATWRPGSQTQASLVLVGVEHAVVGEFYQYLFGLHQQRRIDRIVIHECYLVVLTAASY